MLRMTACSVTNSVLFPFVESIDGTDLWKTLLPKCKNMNNINKKKTKVQVLSKKRYLLFEMKGN